MLLQLASIVLLYVCRYDRKLEQEAKDYNPYGRGGGGAPMRDGQGNLVGKLS